MTAPWLLATVLGQVAMYLGLLGAAGTVLCRIVFRFRDIDGLVWGFAGLGAVGCVAVFLLKAAALTGDASGMTDPVMLGLLWDTRAGQVIALQMAGLAMVAGAQMLPRPMRQGRPVAIGQLGGGMLALSSLAAIGHIADHAQIWLSGLLMVHLMTAAFWIGVLTPLALRARAPERQQEAHVVALQFGRVASLTVPALIAAGVVMGIVLLGSLEVLLTSRYGQFLLVKTAVVAALLGLAAANKWRFVPALLSALEPTTVQVEAQGKAPGKAQGEAQVEAQGEAEAAAVPPGRALARSIWWEWLAVVVVLTLTACLTTMADLPMAGMAH